MSRYPFPHTRRLAHLCYPALARPEDALRAFTAWRSEIVTADGARGFLRARRPDTPDGVANSTVSEGIAYGMIIAVLFDQQALFDDFYRYALCFENKSGLMDWYIAPDGSRALGVGAATDSDEDIAWALVMAHRQWGGQGALAEPYLACAKRQIECVWQTEVDHDRYPDMLLPGDDWRGQNVFNPSYFAPHQYRVFAEVSANPGWLRVIDRGYEIVFASLNAHNQNRDNGLVPAWCNAAGEPVEAFPGALTNYQYDSARLPFRIAQDWAATRDPRAYDYLQRVSAFFARIGADQIVDGYTLAGEPAPDPRAARPNPGSAVFVGAAAVGAMHDPQYRAFIEAGYARVQSGTLLARSRYYNHSWTVLSLLMLSGNSLNFANNLMRIPGTLSVGFGLVFLQLGCATPKSAAPSPSAATQRLAPDATPAPAAPAPAPTAWQDKQLSPEQRAELLLNAMTEDEKLTLVTGYFGVQLAWNHYNFKEARPQSAGFVRGLPRLGFTAQWQTDAGSGVATQREAPPELERTALPSGMLTAATWNPPLAERSGAMIGSEARASGFNVMLAGGVNLMREPGNGRNFEYGGEDPLLAGTIVGALVRGIQTNHIVATVKHFALNNQETGRDRVNAVIDEAAARMSDLLAFQIAIEKGDPGSVMCSYNLVNGAYACQNDWLLNQVLKRDWGFKGYVMTDWGAQHDTVLNANHGLDQETGVAETGKYVWLDKLSAAIRQKQVPPARLDDMVRRIARTLIAKGAVDDPVAPAAIDFAAHAQVTQADAEDGIVLLKNQGVLPLSEKAKRIAVIGGHADVGVLSGGGSAQVYAPGGNAVPGLGPKGWPGPTVYLHSSPLSALRNELPKATISWQSGADLKAAAAAAQEADIALVFVTQWTTESQDFSLTLPDAQDKLVAAVARANKHTVVVLETGGPVFMPWLDQVAGVLEAWYPGSQGGPAIARVLSGAVNPSGHLPVTFPRSLDQLPRAKSAGEGTPDGTHFEVHYDEGAAVGYRWYAKKRLEPLFPFGHGLNYTTFVEDKLSARVDNGELKVTFAVRNTGKRPGKSVAQIYVSPEAGGWESPKRLGAFGKVELAPGAAQELTLTVDPRLLANYEPGRGAFRIAPGAYRVTLAPSAQAAGKSVTVTLPERVIAPK